MGTVAAALALTGPRPLSSAGLEGSGGGLQEWPGSTTFAFSFFFLLFLKKNETRGGAKK